MVEPAVYFPGGNQFAPPPNPQPTWDPVEEQRREEPQEEREDADRWKKKREKRLATLKTNVAEAACDQMGCRRLQDLLDAGRPEDVASIHEQVMSKLVSLMVDPFGNYLCQKVFETCTEEQMDEVLDKCMDHVVALGFHTHGTRTVQKIIEVAKSPKQILRLKDALQEHITDLVQDQNGNHVVQKLLVAFNSPTNDFIYDAIVEKAAEVAMHRHGCCVIQRCIENATEEQKTRLIQKIIDCSLVLIQDPFANYVVQYLIESPALQEFTIGPVIETVRSDIQRLAKQKYSSNVLEKCLKIAPAKKSHLITDELFKDDETLLSIVRDQYGNFVVQTALSACDINLLPKYLIQIRPLIEAMRKDEKCRRIAVKLAKKYVDMAEKYKDRISKCGDKMPLPHASIPPMPPDVFSVECCVDQPSVPALYLPDSCFPVNYYPPSYLYPEYPMRRGGRQRPQG
eukprot:Platyproteum_vivax@DN3852_c0_g1_i1.p1